MALSQRLLNEAVIAHGHLGPFLVIGLRMGLLGRKLCDTERPRCRVAVIERKPPLCTVDGIKTALGQSTLQVRPGPGVCAVFTSMTGKSIALKVRPSVLERYWSVAWDKCEEAAAEVLRSSDEDLFEQVSEPHSTSKSSSG